jgi:hypothetical protein
MTLDEYLLKLFSKRNYEKNIKNMNDLGVISIMK